MKKLETLNDLQSVRAYLTRVGAEVRSLKTAVVKFVTGHYWKDVAVIHFDKDGTVQTPESYMPTDAEQNAIKGEWTTVKWPQLKLVKKTPPLPKELKDIDPDHLFEFRNEHGDLIMLQTRINTAPGEKRYVPWTYWDDNVWRKMEPEGALPLWGLEDIKNHATVFIHEGAKAARAMRRMIERKTDADKKAYAAHPWAEELSAALHVGWIGGALSPSRTDWQALRKAGVKRAYIVSDNDTPGLSAVPAIAYHLNMPSFHIQFTNEWPVGFDLADPFPDELFKVIEGERHYIGPSFRSCLHPATWATDLVANTKGKPSPVLRDHFKELWSYIEEADLFICKEMPEILRTEAILNKMLAGFSHTPDTCKLIVRAYHGRQTKLCYRPDNKGRIVTDKTTSAINLHTPTHIKAHKGSAKVWLEFMEYLVPDKDERHNLMRWCATLIARPDLKMEYGVLMVSEHQGIGKTTLGNSILAPLVGSQNVGFPTENDITTSDFNEWIANKRLVVVNEIYSGHSWRAYNRLKSYITDRDVTVNIKYQRPYTIENWAHIYACSNSMRALKMEGDDRRWFYPELTETSWSRDKFVVLHNWLRSGGLGIIKQWATDWKDYVLPGQRAPMTARKKELIEESRSEAQREVTHLASAMCDENKAVACTMKEVEEWVRGQVQGGKMFDSDYELRKAMKEAGVAVYNRRVKHGGRTQYVLLNPVLVAQLAAVEDLEQQANLVREAILPPSRILGSSL